MTRITLAPTTEAAAEKTSPPSAVARNAMTAPSGGGKASAPSGKASGAAMAAPSTMTAVTNEVPDGTPFRLPAGILGPKVLLTNFYAGSGGDFFPWVFRQQEVGPLIGTRTWGGLVKSSVHYPLVDGGALTAPDNAVFDPMGGDWIAENEGVPPDIEVLVDASVETCEGRDVKGLYKKARAGEIPEFTGISAPYEAPEKPELVLDMNVQSVEESVGGLIGFLEEKEYLAAK